MRKTFRIIKGLLLLWLLLKVETATPLTASAQNGPLVLAFYYAWFDQNTWASGQSVDQPAEPYNSSDRATIERHVTQAQSARVDAFVQSWYGPQEAGNQTETNFRTLLEVAQAKGFKAVVDLEVTSPFLGNVSAVTEALVTLLATHAKHPAYLRYQDKPVIFFWRQQQFSVDQWVAIRHQVDPSHATFWIAEGTDLSYLAVFDGHHLYSIAWMASPADQLAKWGERVRSYATANGLNRLWVATAMPGYDDTHLPRANTFVVPRRNGDYYRETWRAALASRPDLVIITSFNEWPEGTHLEPSVSYGNQYLNITRELVAALRGSPPVAPASTPTGDPTATPEPAATPNGPYIKAEQGANVRSGPDTTFDQVGQLAAGSTTLVIGKTVAEDWWQINFPRGSENTAWVTARVVEFFGDAAAVPVVEEVAGVVTQTTRQRGASAPIAEATTEPTDESTSTGPVVKIPAGGVNVRSGPGTNFDLLDRLDEGTIAAVVGKNETGDWWQIEYDKGENGLGWVADAVVDFSGDADSVPVAPVPGEPTPTPTITPTPTPTEPIIAGTIEVIEPINVRDEPSTESTVIGGLYLGDTADVLAVSKDGDWWLIEFPDGPDGTGWVTAEFVRFQGDRQAVPIFGLGTVTPTPRPTNTPTATPTPKLPKLTGLPTLAPTATSIYQPTAAAILANRGTPDPSLTVLSPESNAIFDWNDIPWGILSILVITGFIWYQYNRRKWRGSGQ